MHGQCVLGHCTCEHGWHGEDCSGEERVSTMSVTIGQGTVILTPSEAVNDYLGPWYTVFMTSMIMFNVIFVGGYFWNRFYGGARGLQAVPFYNYITTSMSYSDYQLRTPGSKPPFGM